MKILIPKGSRVCGWYRLGPNLTQNQSRSNYFTTKRDWYADVDTNEKFFGTISDKDLVAQGAKYWYKIPLPTSKEFELFTVTNIFVKYL